jgi:chromosome segregation ATPase
MDTHGKAISEIEKKLKQTIDGTVTKTIKEAEAEKAKYTKVNDSVKDLTEKINGFMTKFDDIKTEMGDNSKKFESYQQQVETKKVEIRSLEVEIESL